MPNLDLDDLAARYRALCEAREWQQFHSPKNLVMALMGEAGELGELFQWLTEEQSYAIMDQPGRAEAVRDELADVLLYLVRIADLLEVDLGAAARAKLRKNAAKYPVDRARGNALKYTELGGAVGDDDDL